MSVAACGTPHANSHQAVELRRASALLERFLARSPVDVRASFLTGSRAVEGSRDPRSDFDLHVIHRGDWFQKQALEIDGDGLDIVIAPLEYYHDQLSSRARPIATILGDAVSIYDPETLLPALRAAGSALASTGPETPAAFVSTLRHRPVTLLEDAADLLDEHDEIGARYVLGILADTAVTGMLLRKGLSGHGKRRARILRDVDPVAYAALGRLLRSSEREELLRAAEELTSIAYADVGGTLAAVSSARVPWKVAAAFFRP